MQDLHGRVQRDAHGRQNDENGEHACDLELIVVLQDQIAKPLLRADELADHRTQDGHHHADVEANEDIGQRVGQLDHAELLPAGRTHGSQHIELAVIGRLKAFDDVDHDGKKNNQGGNEDL